MKAKIHPKYYPQARVACSCGNTWTTGSTLPEIHTDICSNCHPFYTGEQRIVDTAGQVERFMNRLKQYGDFEEAKVSRQHQAKKKAEQSFLNQQLIALDLPDRLFGILADANYVTVGDVVKQLEADEEVFLGLTGFGPKSLEQLNEKVSSARKTFEATVVN
jgi:large subunit ribosomal protein L31